MLIFSLIHFFTKLLGDPNYLTISSLKICDAMRENQDLAAAIT